MAVIDASQPLYADDVLREVWKVKDSLTRRDGFDIHRIAEAARRRALTTQDADPDA